MSSHIAASGQSCSGSAVVTLTHDTPCTLAISVNQLGNEVLTDGAQTLQTSYKLTGASLQNPDSNWVDSSQFITHVYNIQGAGVDDITLWAQGTAPLNTAAEAGNYTAALVLTVSW